MCCWYESIEHYSEQSAEAGERSPEKGEDRNSDVEILTDGGA
jgi:hypothetical protein